MSVRVNTTLDALLQRLGIYASDRGELAHTYVPTIIPVALVDAGAVTLQATATPFPLGTPASAGELTAPVAGTRLADTLALAAGQWNVLFWYNAGEGSTFRVRKRNAGDTADVWSQRVNGGANPGATALQPPPVGPLRITFANNERLVIENVNAGGVGIVYQANIWTQGPF